MHAAHCAKNHFCNSHRPKQAPIPRFLFLSGPVNAIPSHPPNFSLIPRKQRSLLRRTFRDPASHDSHPIPWRWHGWDVEFCSCWCYSSSSAWVDINVALQLVLVCHLVIWIGCVLRCWRIESQAKEAVVHIGLVGDGSSIWPCRC